MPCPHGVPRKGEWTQGSQLWGPPRLYAGWCWAEHRPGAFAHSAGRPQPPRTIPPQQLSNRRPGAHSFCPRDHLKLPGGKHAALLWEVPLSHWPGILQPVPNEGVTGGCWQRGTLAQPLEASLCHEEWTLALAAALVETRRGPTVHTDPGTKACKIAPLAKEVGVLSCALNSMLRNSRGIYSWSKGLKRSMLKNPISHFLIRLLSDGYDLENFFLCNVINTCRAIWSLSGMSTPCVPAARPAWLLGLGTGPFLPFSQQPSFPHAGRGHPTVPSLSHATGGDKQPELWGAGAPMCGNCWLGREGVGGDEGLGWDRRHTLLARPGDPPPQGQVWRVQPCKLGLKFNSM